MNPGIRFHEQILRRTVLDPNAWSGGADYALFKHAEAKFTFTQAYGRPQARYACRCEGAVRSDFIVDDVQNDSSRKSRYLLKIIASWQNWRAAVEPIRIDVNQEIIYEGPFFLENILTGWPAQYIELPPQGLCDGRNEIMIVSPRGKENPLLLAGVEILRQPDLVDFTVHSSPEVVAAGEGFWVQLHLIKEHPQIQVDPAPAIIEFTGREGALFRFRATSTGENVPIRFASKNDRCKAVIERIIPGRQASCRPIWIGMDGDDLRHDSSGEMDRALSHFIHSGVGNYVGFRAGFGRNSCRELRPTKKHWRRWIRRCRDHGVSVHLSGGGEILDGVDIMAEAGEHFAGFQFHEPYLVFQPFASQRLMTDKLKKAGTLLERKEAYVEYLRARVEHERKGDAAVYSGEPSLTCIYSAEAGVDALLCEPVSNISLLYGAARGTGIPFGAHIPADWYFGYPHDDRALRRLQLAVGLAYVYGGHIIYVESAVFKTNAHDRNDWEDPYCVGVRQVLRDCYSFARQDSRVGTPVVPLALMYGNLESMFWMDDDRIPETVDMGDWDRLHWGLPGSTEHRRVWNASEAWLPRVPLDDPRNESLTHMFTGTPYGPVDVVAPSADLSRYRAVAFLGWNTMNEDIYANLLEFVRKGGTLFLCGCHLDTRVDLSAPNSLLFNGRISELIGAEVAGPGKEVVAGIRSCALEAVTAEQLDAHFFKHELGAGRVYFGNFYDYPSDFTLVTRIADLLKSIAEAVRSASPLQVESSSPYVHYCVWEHEGKKRVYAVDADWRVPEREATLSVRSGGRITTLTMHGGRIAAIDIE